MKVEFQVNGTMREVDAPPMRRLLDVLREDLRLTGTKEGCGEGECGACSVIIDGELVDSCLVAVGQVESRAVTTVEGLAPPDELSPLQRAFIDHGAAQCGTCRPAMVLAAHVLLENTPHPTETEVRIGLAGNLCRCTGYTKIIDAVIACGK